MTAGNLTLPLRNDEPSPEWSAPHAGSDESGALAYWFDIDPAVRREWLDWYVHDHMPSRVGTTFASGRCYEAIRASASHMVLFETSTPEALLAPSYLALLRIVTDEDRARRGWYKNTIRTTFRVSSRVGRGTGSVLGVIRITGGDRVPGEIRHCLERAVVPALGSMPCIGAVHLLQGDPLLRKQMDAVRITGHGDGWVDWTVLIEAGHDVDIGQAFAALAAIDAWRELGLGEVAVLDRYRLLYTMTRSDR